jgi:hypothetical protein
MANRLPRRDKRQPRLRKLKLRGVKAACAQAVAELLQSVTSGDLRATPLVNETSDSNTQLLARGHALGFQTFQPRPIDRLKWQAVLKARLRAGLDRAGRLEGASTPGIGLVALETDGLARGANRPAHPAGTAQDTWAFALQFPPW